jgi:hypothetical protein
VSGTSYTLAAADNGHLLSFTSGSSVTLTVPTGLGALYGVTICQEGAGKVTPTASGTTIHQRSGFTKTSGQWACAELQSRVADVFLLWGDLQ